MSNVLYTNLYMKCKSIDRVDELENCIKLLTTKLVNVENELLLLKKQVKNIKSELIMNSGSEFGDEIIKEE